MNDILSRIGAYKREEIARVKRAYPQTELEMRARSASSPRGFVAAIKRQIANGQFALIAEIKKASPSQGLIRAEFDPEALARAYEAGGATCLSILTDDPSFQGKLEFLELARGSTQLPVLRKDFMYDPYQVLEARAWGADCILIIMAAVEDQLARDLEDVAVAFGMDALLEVHEERELERALGLRSRLIGINNRDLKTFETSIATSKKLGALVPADRICVSESGIFSNADLHELSTVGISTFLVGESLMRASDVAAATRALLRGSEVRAAE